MRSNRPEGAASNPRGHRVRAGAVRVLSVTAVAATACTLWAGAASAAPAAGTTPTTTTITNTPDPGTIKVGRCPHLRRNRDSGRRDRNGNRRAEPDRSPRRVHLYGNVDRRDRVMHRHAKRIRNRRLRRHVWGRHDVRGIGIRDVVPAGRAERHQHDCCPSESPRRPGGADRIRVRHGRQDHRRQWFTGLLQGHRAHRRMRRRAADEIYRRWRQRGHVQDHARAGDVHDQCRVLR